MLSSYGWIIKMKLIKDPTLLKIDITEFNYERKTGGEFRKKPGGDRSRDSQRKLRPLRFGKRGNGVFNKK